jgi:hypothetical protein
MSFQIDQVLEVLKDNNINPPSDPKTLPIPEIGRLDETEEIYPVNLKDIYEDDDEELELSPILGELERTITSNDRPKGRIYRPQDRIDHPCAWYQPIHYFGRNWGIFIRQECLEHAILDIATYIDWKVIYPKKISLYQCFKALRQCAFYELYFHEQFHHKVESFGLRLLVTNGRDTYRNYKSKVYRPTFGTDDCLEEGLANAEIFQRINEPRYKARLDANIISGFKSYLVDSIKGAPAGYRTGINYLSEKAFKIGLGTLQSQMFDASLSPSKVASHWQVATHMTRSLADITTNIWVIIPRMGMPIISSSAIDPRGTISTNKVTSTLTKFYNFSVIKGAGKGSHVKLKDQNGRTVVLSGNRPAVNPKELKDVIEAVSGKRSLQLLDDFLLGNLFKV